VKTIEAFVQAGGSSYVYLSIHGPLDLEDIRKENFESPIVKEVVSSAKESETDTLTIVNDFKAKEPGTFAFCLDNRDSHFMSKFVQLDVRMAKKTEPIVLHVGGDKVAEGEEEELMARTKESISRIRQGMNKILVMQQRDRHRLSLHSEQNKQSHSHVLQGSLIETACFIAASLFQLFFVRRWFATKLGSVRNPGKSKSSV
jgi:hypothetical protein